MSVPLDPGREYQFWTSVLADHARFILDTLQPREERLVQQAGQYHQIFRQLQEAGRGRLTAAELGAAGRAAQSLIGFKQHLLDQSLESWVGINMAPNLLNHMIQEGEQFLKVLLWLGEGETPPLAIFTLDEHNLWLSDAAGHAAALGAELDPTEQELRREAQRFEDLFRGLHSRAWELWRMLERNPRMVPALRTLNQVAAQHIDLFRRWLEEMAEHLAEARILATAEPLLAEHMVREELYYLEKLKTIGQLGGG